MSRRTVDNKLSEIAASMAAAPIAFATQSIVERYLDHKRDEWLLGSLNTRQSKA